MQSREGQNLGWNAAVYSAARMSPVLWSIHADLPGWRIANHMILNVPMIRATSGWRPFWSGPG